MKEYSKKQIALAKLIEKKRHQIKTGMEEIGLVVLDRNIADQMGITVRTLLYICKGQHLPNIVRLKYYTLKINNIHKRYSKHFTCKV